MSLIRPLYQAVAESRSGSLIPLGPKWSDAGPACSIVDTVKTKILRGHERDLGNPHVVRVFSQPE